MTAPLVTAVPMSRRLRITVPPDAYAALLSALAVEVHHGGDVAWLFDDLAITARDLDRPAGERGTSDDTAIRRHEEALAALLEKLAVDVEWDMPADQGVTLGMVITSEASQAIQ